MARTKNRNRSQRVSRRRVQSRKNSRRNQQSRSRSRSQSRNRSRSQSRNRNARRSKRVRRRSSRGGSDATTLVNSIISPEGRPCNEELRTLLHTSGLLIEKNKGKRDYLDNKHAAYQALSLEDRLTFQEKIVCLLPED